MARIRPKPADRRRRLLPAGALAVLLLGPVPGTLADAGDLRDGPVAWYADDRGPIPVPAFTEPGLVPYSVTSFLHRPFSRFWHPGRALRRLGDDGPAGPAGDVNALDEVLDSAWFTNRIGLGPLADEELVQGPAFGTELVGGPDRSEPWVIIGAKTAGVTPGFRIRDARGDVWRLKFDPPEHPGMTIRAGVVSNLVFHALGYNVPVDQLVVFGREDLTVGEGAEIKLPRGPALPLTTANLDSILAATRSVFPDGYHALASRYLDGRVLGPFDDEGRRPDDPNDRVDHQDLRVLRALKVFAAWLNHFDTKRHNTLDVYEGEPGQGFVRHYLIDFASTLGAFGDEPVKRFGYEFGVDVFPILGRWLTLGLVEDPWVALERPRDAQGRILDEVGLFDVETFEPEAWKPDLPHSAMANLDRRDGYWAAKLVSSFTNRQLELLVDRGGYQDPEAAAYLTATLAGRRDRIASYWFGRVAPLDFFRAEAGSVTFSDLGVERGYADPGTTTYRFRTGQASPDRETAGWSAWTESAGTSIPCEVPDEGFIAVEVQVDRCDRRVGTVRIYLGASGRVVALER
ncbi:MAG: hypothetical protein AB7V45_04445 [Candidatus Krumholzibacteriia bacterium]